MAAKNRSLSMVPGGKGGMTRPLSFEFKTTMKQLFIHAFFLLLCKSRNYLLKICEPRKRMIFHFMVSEGVPTEIDLY